MRKLGTIIRIIDRIPNRRAKIFHLIAASDKMFANGEAQFDTRMVRTQVNRLRRLIHDASLPKVTGAAQHPGRLRRPATLLPTATRANH